MTLLLGLRQQAFVIPMRWETNQMDQFTAMMIAEGSYSADEEEQITAWQTLINTGLAWQLQGWFGRTAQALIEDGVCKSANELSA